MRDDDDPDDWDAWDDEPMEFAWDSDACALDDDGQPVNPRACELWIDGLLDAFFTSPEGQALADEQMEHGQLLHHYALSYRGETLRTLGPDDVRYVLTELYPRKVQADPEEADDIVTELRALFRFLEREYGAENAAACRAALTDELRDELAEGLADPSRFGVAKSFLANGRAAGFAMDTQEDLDAFAALENQRLHTEREARAGQESRSSNAPKKGAKKAKKAKRKQAQKSRKRNR